VSALILPFEGELTWNMQVETILDASLNFKLAAAANHKGPEQSLLGKPLSVFNQVFMVGMVPMHVDVSVDFLVFEWGVEASVAYETQYA